MGRTKEEIMEAHTIVAVDTPFDANGDIDYRTFTNLLSFIRDQGIPGVLVAGTTGCGHLLSWQEHVQLIQFAVKHFGQEMIIVGNTGSNNTREAVKATEQGFQVGMDASLLIGPYYGKTTQRGSRRHIESCLGFGPVIVYNVPQRGMTDILPDTMAQLAAHPNFLAVKECMGVKRIETLTAMGIPAFSGNDDEAWDSRHKAGALGVITVAGNLVPSLMMKLMTQPRFSEVNVLHSDLEPLFKWCFEDPNPIPVKTALAMLDVGSRVFRQPYEPVSLALREEGTKLFKRLRALYGNQLIGSACSSLGDDDFSIVL